MTKISVCMIGLNEEEFIKAAVQSCIDWCDELVYVDGGSTDGTLEIIDSFHSRKIKIILSKWIGDFGAQRNIALQNATGDFVVQQDCDEVWQDSAFLIRDIIEKNPHLDVYDIVYVHFIRDLAHIDATVEKHIGINRVFRREGSSYSRHLHELAENPNWKEKGLIDQFHLAHLGYLKGITSVAKKYVMNLEKKSPIHSKEYLVNWRNAHLFSMYPVKKIDPNHWQYPMPLIQLFALDR